MKRTLIIAALFAVALFAAVSLFAKDTEPKFKFAVVKSFTIAPGVEFPPDNIDAKGHLDALYADFTERLVKEKVAGEVVSDSAAAASPADTVVIAGTITGFEKNGRNMAHPSELHMHYTITRMGNDTRLVDISPDFKMLWETIVKEKYFGNAVSNWSIYEIKKALK
jgi:hypothetical protein